jgi:LPXTG-motif cell wall-anchored protein
MNWKRWTLSIAALALVSAIASAQVVTDIQKGTVVTTWADQLVVKMPDGTFRQFSVPPGFQFDSGGQKVGLADLKPGQELTAKITTTTTPKTVQTTEIRNGKVVAVNGRTLIYQDDAGKNGEWTPPSGFKFMIDGQPTDVADLKPNTRLTATIIRTTTSTESKKSYQVAAGESQADKDKKAADAAAAKAARDKAAADKAAADRAAADKAAADKAAADRAAADKAAADKAAADKAAADAAAAKGAKKKLPKTGSELPLVGALGAASLALGAGLTLRRKLF